MMDKTYSFTFTYAHPKMRDGFKTAVIKENFRKGQDPMIYCKILLSKNFIQIDGGFIPTHGIYEVEVKEVEVTEGVS